MPGWFVHMEAARVAVQRMRDTDLPASAGLDPKEAKALGELAYKWRNYLAIGALGPDLFYLLPDYKDPVGNVLLSVVKWLLDEWEKIDDLFVGSWEKWIGPIGANDADLTNQLTGGLSNQLAQISDAISRAEFDALLSLATRMGDWFSKLTSGPPQGFSDAAFYWSDMFHYRRTYEFPRTLLRKARETSAQADKMEADIAAAGRTPTDAERAEIDEIRDDGEAQQAFAIGWITHCATDVTGHPFTNAKCGGPFRLHWQRHHLVENHMDSAAYEMGHAAASTYEEIGTSALHFRIAFRTRTDSPYNGRADAPAYDYFAGFPAYALGETAIEDELRRRFFDMDPGELPDHLVQLMTESMKEVYYPGGPQVLSYAPGFNDPDVDPATNQIVGPSGRPNATALNEMWNIAFRYLRHISSDGLKPRKPMRPPFFTTAPFPTPPGGTLPPEDDGRGGDPGDDTNPHGMTFNVVDFFIGLFAWIEYIGQVVEWLLTVLPSLALDPLTFPAREFLYYTVVAPTYSLHMAARKLLVLEGFLVPKPSEIEMGLTTLGARTGQQRQTLGADLDDPTGFAMSTPTFDEPSGRVSPNAEFGANPAFPRQSMSDPQSTINHALSPIGISVTATPSPTPNEFFSHWVAPWRYPDADLDGDRIGWEPDSVHPGPWTQGTVATELFARADTDLEAAQRFETAHTPACTYRACQDLFPKNQHLGHPVEYSLYLIKRLGDPSAKVPDFNLDSDRGYGYHCWDYDRHAPGPLTAPPHGRDDFHVYDPTRFPPLGPPSRPELSPGQYNANLDFEQPCTVPEQFDPRWSAARPGDGEPPPPMDLDRSTADSYRPKVPLHIHYLDGGAEGTQCTTVQSTTDFASAPNADIDRAGMNPDGTEIT